MAESGYPLAPLLPEITDENRAYWEGLNEGEVRLKHCTSCDAYQYPPEPFCFQCGSWDVEWKAVTANGTVYTFIIVHQRYHPAFTDRLPYSVAVVELEEGPRLLSNLVNVGNDEIKIGMRVRPSIQRVSEEQSALFFEPA